jgi:hypothetical protein
VERVERTGGRESWAGQGDPTPAVIRCVLSSILTCPRAKPSTDDGDPGGLVLSEGKELDRCWDPEAQTHRTLAGHSAFPLAHTFRKYTSAGSTHSLCVPPLLSAGPCSVSGWSLLAWPLRVL